MTINEAMMLSSLPKMDIHGEISSIATVRINDFIKEQIKMKNEYVEIIFGNGQGILRKTTYNVLRVNKSVIEYKSPYNNRGSVILHLNLTNSKKDV